MTDLLKSLFDPAGLAKGLLGVQGGFYGSLGASFGKQGAKYGEMGAAGADYDPKDHFNMQQYFNITDHFDPAKMANDYLSEAVSSLSKKPLS